MAARHTFVFQFVFHCVVCFEVLRAQPLALRRRLRSAAASIENTAIAPLLPRFVGTWHEHAPLSGGVLAATAPEPPAPTFCVVVEGKALAPPIPPFAGARVPPLLFEVGEIDVAPPLGPDNVPPAAGTVPWVLVVPPPLSAVLPPELLALPPVC